LGKSADVYLGCSCRACLVGVYRVSSQGVAKKYTSAGLAWWFAALLGFAVAGFSGANSTMPSSAPRNTLTGEVQGCTEHVLGRSNYTYTFLLNRDGQSPIEIATRIKPPLCWRDYSSGSSADIYRVVYLDDPNRDLKHEAIRIEVVAGTHAGWRASVDARPFGLWLGIPAGIVLIFVGGIGAVRHRRKLSESLSVAVADGALVKDQDSNLTDLNLH
jgi:hypothetical protein